MDQPVQQAGALQADRLGKLGKIGTGATSDGAATPPQRLQVVVAGMGSGRELVPATGVSLGALQTSGGWMDPRGIMEFCDPAQAADPAACVASSTIRRCFLWWNPPAHVHVIWKL
jgi:hypothetical protein